MANSAPRFELSHAVEFVTSVRQHIETDQDLRNYVDFVAAAKLPNFWSILEYGQTLDSTKKNAHETRISRMLRWLMDPSENHGIGSEFVDMLIDHCEGARVGNTAAPTSYTDAEYKHIDVLYSDNFANPSVFVAVEVKQYSAEHNRSGQQLSQLDHYDKVLRETWSNAHRKSAGIDTPENIHRVFLTIDGTEAQSKSRWHSLSYRDLSKMLRRLFVFSSELNFVKILQDFIDELERCRIQFAFETNSVARTVDALKTIDSDFLDAFTSDSKTAPESMSASAESFEDERASLETPEETLDVTSLVRQVCAARGESFEVIRAAATAIADSRVIQNHSPNENVKAFMRRLFDRLTDVPPRVGRIPLRSDLARQLEHTVGTVTLELTSPKGQGIHFFSEHGGTFKNGAMGYISGDYKGTIPNDRLTIWNTKLDIGKYDVNSITSDANFESFVNKIENAILNVPAEFGTQK